MRRTGVTVVALVLAALLGLGVWWMLRGAGPGLAPDDNDPLVYIPADTPYVFATNAARSEEEAEVLLRMQGYSADSIVLMADELRAAAGKTGNMGPAMLALADLLMQAEGKSPKEIMANLGLALNARSALYGVGLSPVLRLELADPDATRAAIARVEEAVGGQLQTAQIDGHEYRYLTLGDKPLRAVLAVLDRQLVLALAADPTPDAALRALLGLTRPSESLRASGALDRIAKRDGFDRHVLGYVNTSRILAALWDQPSTSDQAVAAAFALDLSAPDSVCRGEYEQLAALMPEWTFGLTRLDARQVDVLAILHLREDIAKTLTRIAQPIAGWHADAAPVVLEFGMASNLGALPQAIADLVGGVEKAPWQCPQLAALNDSAPKIKTQVANPGLLVAATMFHSGYLRADAVRFDDGVSAVPEVHGAVVVGSQNPAALLGTARSMLPGLSEIEVSSDGKPVTLPDMPALNLRQPLQVAMDADALVFTIGADMGSTIPALLEVDSAQAPLLIAGVDSAVYADMMRWASKVAADKAGAEAGERQRRAAEMYSKMFRHALLRIDLSERGVELREEIRMQ